MTLLDRLLDSRRAAPGIVAIALAVGALALWSGTTTTLDRIFEPLRFGAAHRVASGKMLVVEMDAASTARLRRWPWSRSNYAQVVDNLRRAGAASIVFDVDFSSSSDATGDAAFAAALKRSGGIVALPTFGQPAGSEDLRTIDALPIAAFRQHVALASVNVAPDSDGMVRTMPFGTITAGIPRPSLSAFVAGRSGRADQAFPIDMSIDPNTVPRLSFVAVRDGYFDTRLVHGRQVMIGATAIEMGDRYGTVSWGVIPGVVVQALAAETLLRGIPVQGSAFLTLALAVGLSFGVAFARTQTHLVVSYAIATALLVGAVCTAQYWLYFFLPMAIGMVVLSATAALAASRLLLRQLRSMRMMDEPSGLSNRRAMIAQAFTGSETTSAVLRITNLESIAAVLGNGAKTDAIVRVAERARLVAQDQAVFRITEQALAFIIPANRSLDDVLSGFRSVMLQPVEVAGRRIDVIAAVGIAQGVSARPNELLDAAMRAAEDAAAKGVFWRSAETDVDALERSITLMGQLDAAIVAGDIAVYYQPKLDLRSGRITSAEALVRWPHRERGFVAPDMFIPMAEQTDRIAPLTRYVLNRAIADQLELRAAGLSVTVAINISAKLLGSTSFVAEVEAILHESKLPPSALVFEVTESAALADPDAAIAALRRFRALGVAISMDDYGTGQSTLTYLRSLPLSELKIDRSFVQHAHHNQNDALLVRSTVDLAHEMGLKVVAEGVEEVGCIAFLRSIGCDTVQGYLVSRPLPPRDFEDFLRAPVNQQHSFVAHP